MTHAGNDVMFSASKDHSAWMTSYSEVCLPQKNPGPFLSSFCQWFIDEHGRLKRNPSRSLEVLTQQVLSPRVLSEKQCLILRVLVEQAEDLLGEAIFTLCSWSRCRVSDGAHLLMELTHVKPKIARLHIGCTSGKFREIDLINQVLQPLFEYLQSSEICI